MVVYDRVTIVGAGLVGSTIAYAMMIKGTTSEIVMVDVNEKRLEGEVMDLNHGIAFAPSVKIRKGDYEDCAESNIVIISAGVSQKPGESRLELLKRNTQVFSKIVPNILKYSKDCIILVVTNPVDVLTYVTIKLSALPQNQVFGSGTVLDSARLRYLISNHCGVSAQNVHTYIIGEHGDSEVAAWSITNIAGMSMDDYCIKCDNPCKKNQRLNMFHRARDSAYKIIDAKGSTYYAVGLAVDRIVRAILRNENSILSVSSFIDGNYGINDVCLSLPSIVNERGIDTVLNLPLDENEIDGLRASSELLKKSIREIGI